ncbi:MAG TPA: glycosyltransferase family 2 protein [Candidatus Methanoperedens sp.]|nr:glycosyltransferase family 2 protein [Candidatus Methanoperedens sp.]
MLTDRSLSVVVTCYRDEGSVRELLRRLVPVLERITPDWEVIYVNDDSPDNAEAVLLEEARREPRLTVISHARNFGAQVAFTTGLAQARGDAVVIMDGDLQDPPELIETFARKWLAGYDVVYGIRAKRREVWYRNLGYKAFYRIFHKISYIRIPLDAGEFSLMDRVVVDVVLHAPERDRLIRGLRAYAGFHQTGVPFERPERFAGESTQGFLDYLMWAYKSFVSYSLFPLRLITSVAFLMAGFTLLVLVFNLVGYFASLFLGKERPPGYMTTITVLLLLGTTMMLALGVIGEYLGRLFLEIKNRPQPVLRGLVNDHRSQPLHWHGRTGQPRSVPAPAGEAAPPPQGRTTP